MALVGWALEEESADLFDRKSERMDRHCRDRRAVYGPGWMRRPLIRGYEQLKGGCFEDEKFAEVGLRRLGWEWGLEMKLLDVCRRHLERRRKEMKSLG